MRLTTQLGWVLLAVVTIYWNGTPVLSLPPSLIANAASLRQNHRPMDDLPKDHRNNNNNNNHNSRKNLTEAESFKAGSPSSSLLLLAPADVAPNSLDLNVHQPSNENVRDPLTDSYVYESHDNDDDDGNGYVDFTDISSEQGQSNGRYNAEDEDEEEAELKRQLPPSSVYELNELLNMANRPNNNNNNNHNEYESDLLLRDVSPRIRAVPSPSKSHTPLQYWPRQCRLNNNCLQEYYTALFSGSSPPSTGRLYRDPLYPAISERDEVVDDTAESLVEDDDENASLDDDDDLQQGELVMNERASPSLMPATNDIYMLINGEQDVVKFLQWAMQQLYPVSKFENLSDSGADNYHSGMFLWKKLNSSGRLEPPLLVEEPHYIIVRREKLQDTKEDGQYDDDPFIPPRGRKDDGPNLSALLQRYETFVPNRGRRDKISDIFKHDDLFYPNRGKKAQWNPSAVRLASLQNDLVALKGNAVNAANGIDNEPNAFWSYKTIRPNQSVKMSPAQMALRAMSTPSTTRQQEQQQQQQHHRGWQMFNDHSMPLKQWQQLEFPLNGQRRRRGGGVGWATGARIALSNNRFHSSKLMPTSRGHQQQQQHQHQQQKQQKKQRSNQQKHFQQRRSMFIAPIWRQLLEQKKLGHLALSPMERVHQRQQQHQSLETQLDE